MELGNLVSKKLIRGKFPALKANEADFSSVRPSSSLAYRSKLEISIYKLNQEYMTTGVVDSPEPHPLFYRIRGHENMVRYNPSVTVSRGTVVLHAQVL